jgi:hypothetical protein
VRLCQFVLSRTQLPWSVVQKLIRRRSVWVESGDCVVRGQDYKLKMDDKVCLPPGLAVGEDKKQLYDPAVFKEW